MAKVIPVILLNTVIFKVIFTMNLSTVIFIMVIVMVTVIRVIMTVRTPLMITIIVIAPSFKFISISSDILHSWCSIQDCRYLALRKWLRFLVNNTLVINFCLYWISLLITSICVCHATVVFQTRQTYFLCMLVLWYNRHNLLHWSLKRLLSISKQFAFGARYQTDSFSELWAFLISF